MNELYSTVERHLRKQGSDAETQQLWQQLFEAFQDEGEDGVENCLEVLLERPEEE